MVSDGDKRGELRLDQRAAVFVELEAADPVSGEARRVLMCRLEDFSANGLRIRMDRPLVMGSVHSLGVRFARSPQMLWLMGEVRWVLADEDRYRVGFSLYESHQTDIAQWKLLVADELAPDGPAGPSAFDNH